MTSFGSSGPPPQQLIGGHGVPVGRRHPGDFEESGDRGAVGIVGIIGTVGAGWAAEGGVTWTVTVVSCRGFTVTGTSML